LKLQQATKYVSTRTLNVEELYPNYLSTE